MNATPALGPLVQTFFHDYLTAQRGVSPNTVLAYRDSLKLFLSFSVEHLRKAVDKLAIEDLDDTLVLAFLDHLENVRGNSPKTRNLRLAALRAFFRFVASQEPSAQVKLLGKGRKQRACPLWPETAAAIQDYLDQRSPAEPQIPYLFLNARGHPLTRYGIRHLVRQYAAEAGQTCPALRTKRVSPHTFRHTTAMHLLQAGNDISVVKAWLRHASVQTTHTYVEIDMEMKRKALDTCQPDAFNKATSKRPKWLEPDILQWLQELSREAKVMWTPIKPDPAIQPAPT